MTLFSKLLVWSVLSVLAAVGAKAAEINAAEINAEDIQASNALICGTADQAKTFVTSNDDLDHAIAGVNETGAGSNCLAALIAYIPGKAMDRVERKDGTYVVTEILIVGVGTPYGMLAAKPSVAYTVLKMHEESA